MYVGDLELSKQMDPPHTPYSYARLLVRLHGRPIGDAIVHVGHEHDSLADHQADHQPDQHAGHQVDQLADRLAAEVFEQLGDAINQHLADDGLPGLTRLPASGLGSLTDEPACRLDRATGAAVSATVVIATRNRTRTLIRCLDSVAVQDHPGFDVVVVDSAPSGDDTARLFAGTDRWPLRLTYVRADRPGLATAHNAAIPYIEGAVAAFTDDDVVVDKHWLTAISAPFRDDRVGCVTGLILPGELDTAPQLWLEQSGGFSRGLISQRFGLDLSNDDPLFPFAAGRFGSGANMAFRTSWLRSNGGFDEAIGAGTVAMGGDDLLAFLQVLLDGHHLVYEPNAVIRHWHRRDFDGLNRQMYGYGVGLGAYLTAAVRSRPSILFPMLARSAGGVRHLLSAGSIKNSQKSSDYPRRLDRQERLGMLAGPIAYSRSVRRLGR